MVLAQLIPPILREIISSKSKNQKLKLLLRERSFNPKSKIKNTIQKITESQNPKSKFQNPKSQFPHLDFGNVLGIAWKLGVGFQHASTCGLETTKRKYAILMLTHVYYQVFLLQFALTLSYFVYYPTLNPRFLWRQERRGRKAPRYFSSPSEYYHIGV